MPKTALAQPVLAATLIEDILRRVETLPEGPELRRKLERRREISDQLSSGRQTISIVIAAGLFAVLVLKIVFVLGAFANPILSGYGLPLVMAILGFCSAGSAFSLSCLHPLLPVPRPRHGSEATPFQPAPGRDFPDCSEPGSSSSGGGPINCHSWSPKRHDWS